MTRILVIEDEQSYREAMAFMLSREGFEVGRAADGAATGDAVRSAGAPAAGSAADVPAPDRAEGGDGLRLLRARMDRAGGTVTIDSTPGEGTAVGLTLPLRDQEVRS